MHTSVPTRWRLLTSFLHVISRENSFWLLKIPIELEAVQNMKKIFTKLSNGLEYLGMRVQILAELWGLIVSQNVQKSIKNIATSFSEQAKRTSALQHLKN